MAGIKEVAQKAGVSVATVSRVINEEKTVKPETAARVKAVMAELAYQPNLLGRNLRTQKTGTVLTLIPSASNQFYSKILRGIEDNLAAAGIRALFGVTRGDQAKEADFLSMLCQKRVDGVISLQSAFSGEALAEKIGNLPFVYCCEYPENSPFPTVGIDNFAAAKEATEVLMQQAGNKIGMIGFSDYAASGQAREAGYRAAMEEAGREASVISAPAGQHTFEGGLAACETYLCQHGLPDGFFCASDLLAAGVLKCLEQQSKKAKIIGFDDTAITRMLSPTLSSVAQPRYELGQRAAELLLAETESPKKAAQHLVLPHRLILRESCGGTITE